MSGRRVRAAEVAGPVLCLAAFAVLLPVLLPLALFFDGPRKPEDTYKTPW